MGFRKAKDFKDQEIIENIENGIHDLYWVPNDKTNNVRIINKVDDFFVVFIHKKYENNIIKMKICDKDPIIDNNECILCHKNKAIKTYFTEIIILDFYYKPKQIKTKIWMVPPFKYTDVFSKFNIIQSKNNRNYDIKDYVFIINRIDNKYTMSYDKNHKLNHNFISANEDYWINFLKNKYYNDVNLDN